MTDPVFTADMLRPIIKKSFKTENRTTPSTADLNKLAQRLEALRWFTSNAKNLQSAREAKKKARAAAHKYEEALREVQGYEEEFLALAEQDMTLSGDDGPLGYRATSVRLLKRQISDLEQMRVAINEHLDSEALRLIELRFERWHSIALGIVDAYREAVTPNNPGFARGLSENGPVARFVADILPSFGSPVKSISSIGRQLIQLENQRTAENREKPAEQAIPGI
ncbi:MAG TPA: hypothetical protein VFX06_06285 [Stellaceae bacterium]|nr:hypothetical protein [Stellaceae bacterium]